MKKHQASENSVEQDQGRHFTAKSVGADGHSFTGGDLARQDCSEIEDKRCSCPFGRDLECSALFDAYIRQCTSNRKEMILITGSSGTGKTFLAETLRGPVEEKHGIFVTGKFDQLQRPEPFSPFVSAITELSAQLNPAQIAKLKQEKLDDLETDQQLLLHMIPALGTVLLDQEISDTETDVNLVKDFHCQRFLVALTRFFRIVCDAGLHVVLFFDDLQWADNASLELIHMLAMSTQLNGLVVLGACRDDDVSFDGSLACALRSLEKNGVNVTEIKLANFNVDTVTRYIARELELSADDCRELGEMIHRQSNGNIFFVTRYMINMFDQNAFSHDGERYHWNQRQLDETVGKRSSVELVAIDLQRLHKDRTYIMQVAACLGASFDEMLLHLVIRSEDLHLNIKALIETKVLAREKGTLKFCHDQVHQACYCLIPKEGRPAFHLKIGQNLKLSLTDRKFETHLFAVASQIIRGASVIKEPQERTEMALICLHACQKAVSLASFGTAACYADAGIEILGEDAFETDYNLALSMYNAAAEIAYCNGENEKMQERVKQVLENASNLHDKLQGFTTQVIALGTSQKIEEATELGFHVLRLLGERVPNSIGTHHIIYEMLKTSRMLRRTTHSKIISLPAMTNVDKIAAMKIIDLLSVIVFTGKPEYVPIMSCRHVQLTLQYGLNVFSSSGFVMYSVCLSSISKKKDEAYRYGSLGVQIMEKYNIKQWISRVTVGFHGMITPWREPWQNSFTPLKDAYYLGQRTGDFEAAALSAFLYSTVATEAGLPLSPLMTEMLAFREMCIAYRQDTILSMLIPYVQGVSNFLGEASGDPLVLTGNYMDQEEQAMLYQTKRNGSAASMLLLVRSYIAVHMGEYSLVAKLSQTILNGHGREALAIAIAHFFKGTAAFSLFRETRISRHVKVARKALKQVRSLAMEVPCNFLDKMYFLEAELASVKGRVTDALTWYRLAISFAQKEGFLQYEAMYNERRAMTLRCNYREKEAMVSLKRAHELYGEWGCVIAVQRLAKLMIENSDTNSHGG